MPLTFTIVESTPFPGRGAALLLAGVRIVDAGGPGKFPRVLVSRDGVQVANRLLGRDPAMQIRALAKRYA